MTDNQQDSSDSYTVADRGITRDKLRLAIAYSEGTDSIIDCYRGLDNPDFTIDTAYRYLKSCSATRHAVKIYSINNSLARQEAKYDAVAKLDEIINSSDSKNKDIIDAIKLKASIMGDNTVSESRAHTQIQINQVSSAPAPAQIHNGVVTAPSIVVVD